MPIDHYRHGCDGTLTPSQPCIVVCDSFTTHKDINLLKKRRDLRAENILLGSYKLSNKEDHFTKYRIQVGLVICQFKLLFEDITIILIF